MGGTQEGGRLKLFIIYLNEMYFNMNSLNGLKCSFPMLFLVFFLFYRARLVFLQI